MPPVKKAPAAAPAADTRVNFGDLASYGGGSFLLPEGDYAVYHDVRHHAYTKQDGTQGQQMLGVMLTCYPLAGGDPHEQFLSLGRKSIASFAPDADNPADNGFGSKSLKPIPGAPAATLSGMTNFNLYLKSLYDCGLPEGIFTNDVSVLDGIWVHTQNVPAPETRKNLGAQTGEAAQEQQNRGPDMICVVTEIKDDGKPWEGTGGMPEGAGEAPAAPAPKAAPKPAAKPATGAAKPTAAAPKPAPAKAAKPAPAPHAGAAEDGADVLEAALAGATDVLAKFSKGTTRLMLRTQAFKHIKETYGDALASASVEQFFSNDEGLEALVSQLGYTVSGQQVVPA